MTTAASSSVSSPHPTAKRKLFTPRPLAGLALSLSLLFSATPVQAQYATGGIGQYRSQILWFEWGTAPNNIPQLGTTVTNTVSVSGVPLAVTCTLSAISGNGPDPDLRIYRPGGYGWDGLDDLYNIGGTGGANSMDIGLINRTGGSQATFTFACAATLGGVPYVLDGLVFADAETTDTGEFIRTVPVAGATLRVIERYREPGCTGGYNVNLTAGTYQFTTITGCSGQPNPMGIYFLDNAASATITLQGGVATSGLQAVAVGVMLSVADYGDAPSSYGSAGHLPQYAWSGGTLPSGNTDIFSAGFSPATLTQPTTALLGTRVDVENPAWAGAGATLDDGNGAVDDEDSVNTATLAPLYRGLSGNSYTVPVVCVGTASVAGWIDFDLNGTFDGDERSATAICSGGSATLSWTVPADVTAGSSYLRVRTATSALEIASATGIAGTGEAEDYALTITDPKVRVAKLTQGGVGGPFAFSTTNTLSQPAGLTTVTADTAVTGTPVSIDDIATSVAVTETALPTGWALSAIACTQSGGAPVAGATYDLANRRATVPSSALSATSDITCAFTNGKLPVLTVRKISQGGVDSFDFTGDNGIAAQTLTTTVAGTPVDGATQVLTTAGAVTTITEAQVPINVVPTFTLTDITCAGLGAGGIAVRGTAQNKNRITLNAAATAFGASIVCTFTNVKSPTVQLRKSWVSAIVNDFYRLTASGTGPNHNVAYAFNLDSTANTANETDNGGAQRVGIGDTVTLSETAGVGNVGIYTASAWACTGGSLSGNTLTIGAADVGAAIVCSITNTGKVANLTITKTNTPVSGPNDQAGDTLTRGTTTTYTIVVTNNGPDTVTGAMLRDPAASRVGLTCASAPVCTGSACPGGLTMAALDAGVPLGALANGATVVVSFPCTVN
ncbi:CshA/CshB family fibrillar adhesin-related protein [Lysobacter antibioticus]|uniref:CshA/CshB family fibrillar adhesin-related protein n=1 Tax=Lysobacter antibioticus TaxID=84531 RepID=UPI0016514493|nr:CshA/CshB family fibrillar adhesin-related protein [Lysobacter antibioticus]